MRDPAPSLVFCPVVPVPASGRAHFGELHIFGLGFGTEFPEKYGPTGTEDSKIRELENIISEKANLSCLA